MRVSSGFFFILNYLLLYNHFNIYLQLKLFLNFNISLTLLTVLLP